LEAKDAPTPTWASSSSILTEVPAVEVLLYALAAIMLTSPASATGIIVTELAV
jgi:hypothetical protein